MSKPLPKVENRVNNKWEEVKGSGHLRFTMHDGRVISVYLTASGLEISGVQGDQLKVLPRVSNVVSVAFDKDF